MSAPFSVDPDQLHALAGQAQQLSEELGSLTTGGAGIDVTEVGDAGLAAALEEFDVRWAQRVAEMQAELGDAAEFLRTFADVAAQTDGAVVDPDE